jgi:predicted DCC family thiol-disulfide oxidoreductase YuxK
LGAAYCDADCGLCAGFVRRLGAILTRRGFALVPKQSAAARERLGLHPGELSEEMKLILPGGRHLGGLAALTFMARRVRWFSLPAVLTGLPGVRAVANAGYRWLERSRRCFVPARRGRKRRHHGATTFFEMP